MEKLYPDDTFNYLDELFCDDAELLLLDTLLCEILNTQQADY